ncbi:ATP-binding protein, partial [Escherichia coli]|nr:ATP-binding protein [Escherichia coli]
TASFSQVLSTVDLVDAPWAVTPRIPLNPGLVAIIGARGSGKTALADAIAHGCDATEDPPNAMSFLARASELLAGNSVRLTWGDGTTDTR